MLIELTPQGRVKKLQELSTSKENRKYSEYYDYYKGEHFVKSTFPYDDQYRRYRPYYVLTRSGQSVFDSPDDDKQLFWMNWCRMVIDTISDYSRGVNEDIVITADSGEEELTKVWKDNNINTLTKEIACEAGKFGKTFLKLRKINDKIQLYHVDPASVYQIIDPISNDVLSVIYYYSISVEDARQKFPGMEFGGTEVYYAEEWTPYFLFKFINGEEIQDLNEMGEARIGNPYGFIPFYEVKADIDGDSDIVDVIPLNDEYNMILTFNHESLKYHGFPMYSPDGSFNSQTNVLDPSALKDVRIAPKTFLNFPAKRIESEGVSDSIIKYIEQLRVDISIAGGVPLKLLTSELDGNLSGVALQRLMAPLIKKAEDRRNYIKEAYKRINNDILRLIGLGEAETDVIFPAIVNEDMNEQLDEAIKKNTLGISKQTIFEELGYDYEEEHKATQKEFDNDLQRTTDELKAISKVAPQQPGQGAKVNQGKAGRGNKPTGGNKR